VLALQGSKGDVPQPAGVVDLPLAAKVKVYWRGCPMKYRVYCGMLDWYVTVEASSEDEAIRQGKKMVMSRIDNEASWWASAPIEAPPTGNTGVEK
jgi:hypothetical protein